MTDEDTVPTRAQIAKFLSGCKGLDRDGTIEALRGHLHTLSLSDTIVSIFVSDLDSYITFDEPVLVTREV